MPHAVYKFLYAVSNNGHRAVGRQKFWGRLVQKIYFDPPLNVFFRKIAKNIKVLHYNIFSPQNCFSYC